MAMVVVVVMVMVAMVVALPLVVNSFCWQASELNVRPWRGLARSLT